MSRKAMQMALEALELLARYENPSTKIQVRKPKDGGSIVTMYPHKVATEAAAALRGRLAQPEQDPVAWISDSPTKGNGKQLHWTKSEAWRWSSNITPLYTAPPKAAEWVGLTAPEVQECYDLNPARFASRIEAKLKEKNT